MLAISLRKKQADKKVSNEETINNGNNNLEHETVETSNTSSIDRRKIFTVFMIIVMISCASIISVISYDYIHENRKVDDRLLESYISSYKFKNLVNNVSGELAGLLDSPGQTTYYVTQIRGLKYYAKDLRTYDVKTNVNKVYTSSVVENKDRYLYFLHLAQDENNNYSVVENMGLSGGSFYSSDSYNDDKKVREYYFFLDRDYFNYNDALKRSLVSYAGEELMPQITIIWVINGLLALIVGLLIRYARLKQISFFDFYNRMYIEFKAVVLICVVGIIAGSVAILLEICGRSMDYLIYYKAGEFYFIFVMGIVATWIVILLNVCYLKYIKDNGFKKGLVKNSFILSIVGYLYKKVFIESKNNIKRLFRITIDALLNPDKDKTSSTLVRILLVNGIILIAIALSGFVGIVIAIIYSLLLFKLFSKQIRELYSLNKSVEELTKGNFNVEFKQEIMILEPIISKLSLIKNGLKVALEKETKSERLKAELISNVSHDLRTPLTSIINYVDLMGKEDLSDTQREYIDILDKKSMRLKNLIDDLFEVSKASSGSIDMNLTEIDIVYLLRQTMAEFEDGIETSNLDFRINLPEDKVVYTLDGKKMYRVFENLIGNILKYSLNGSRVYIDLKESDTCIEIIFKNISAYEMNFDPEEIMDRLSRGDESRNTDGSGLGLAIAKSLVLLQGGDIDIYVDGDLFKLTIVFPK